MENYKLDFLRGIRLFSSLKEEELSAISSKVVLKEFGKNETILLEEDTNTYMYMIIFGNVKVVRTDQNGKETILAMHQSGDFFGEMSLIDGKTTPAAVITTEDSLIGIVSKENFYSLLLTQRKVLDQLLQVLCSRVRESWRRIQILNFKYASQRIRMLFFMLSEQYGVKTPDGITLNIALTHQAIADMTGLTRESATRVIDRWLKDGEITVLKNKVIQLNPKFLQRDFGI